MNRHCSNTKRPKYHENAGGVAPYWETDPSIAAPVLLVAKPRIIGGKGSGCYGNNATNGMPQHEASQMASRIERHTAHVIMHKLALGTMDPDKLPIDFVSSGARAEVNYRVS